MKSYHSISKDIRSDVPIYAFNKLDGSCIRAEWSKKRGFYKFGSKTQLLGPDHPILGSSIQLIQEKYSEELGKVFSDQKYDNVVCFFEYYGPGSFAGSHILEEQHTVSLFDVNLYKSGLMSPGRFIELFNHLDLPSVLYYGNANSDFIKSVRDGTLSGMSLEGCVCKSNILNKYKVPIMFKVKSNAWLQKLKEHCKNDQSMFDLLS